MVTSAAGVVLRLHILQPSLQERAGISMACLTVGSVDVGEEWESTTKTLLVDGALALNSLLRNDVWTLTCL